MRAELRFGTPTEGYNFSKSCHHAWIRPLKMFFCKYWRNLMREWWIDGWNHKRLSGFLSDLYRQRGVVNLWNPRKETDMERDEETVCCVSCKSHTFRGQRGEIARAYAKREEGEWMLQLMSYWLPLMWAWYWLAVLWFMLVTEGNVNLLFRYTQRPLLLCDSMTSRHVRDHMSPEAIDR